MTKKNKVQDNFDYLLKDFESDPDPKVKKVPLAESTWTIKENRIKLPSNLRIYHPYIIFIIFVHLKNFKYFGREEKVAWTIPVKFKGHPFILTHRKFGFNIISNEDGEEITKIAHDAISCIKKATPYAETLIESVIVQLVKKGNVTLENECRTIQSRYIFFRKKAEKEFKQAIKNKDKFKKTERKGKGMIASVTYFEDLSVKYRLAGNNYATAMLDSYFSLLEHVLVLLLPFVLHIKFEEIDLNNFISLNWREKLKITIELEKDANALILYERLSAIKEDLRNPLTHGYFLKDGNSLYVHMPQVGTIPMNLTKTENHLNYAFFAVHEANFDEIIKTFDEFYDYLKTNPSTMFGMKYIETGLPIAFDLSSRQGYKYSMTDIHHFDAFIRQQGMDYTNAMNMDW
jgi:hypothetical protein